jgi:hypothetical protein
MKTEKHVIELPERTGVLTVTEHSDRIVVTAHFTKAGDLGDGGELGLWLLSIFETLEKRGLPITLGNYLVEGSDAAFAVSLGKLKMAIALIATGNC